MKKIIYFLLPALFMTLGAGKAIKTVNTDDSNKQLLNDLKSSLEDKKETKQRFSLYREVAEEIKLNQKVSLQKSNTSETKTRIFKLNLPQIDEEETIKLVDQEEFYSTDEEEISWKWDNLPGKYAYKFTAELDPEENCAFITVETLDKAGKDVPYTAISFTQEGNGIYLQGVYSIGMDSGASNGRPFFIIEEAD